MTIDNHQNQASLRDITPDMKIGELLEAYPKLEGALSEISPQFARLKNPILRRTVGRVATIRQAAKVGGVSLAQMINTLRKAAGLAEAQISEESRSAHGEPPWVKQYEIARSLDARSIIERGEHPLTQVMSELNELKQNQRYELITPFPPEPLIDKARSKGFLTWSIEEANEVIKTYFARQ